ncbi:MAG TPA: hypothetical protein PLF44_00605 [Candidatus Mcinerneyibacteriales bacterium]|nr:hypothetical protein [Candidatus Mcinerneyibacteriales bacterium]HPJ69357.1 hypothetical protein [Candidatus Mcinerneyibacteriales bacterium]HPQ90002.1 hypothetical protein [Candidatus Mcinerneyibacteriales bacterium]
MKKLFFLAALILMAFFSVRGENCPQCHRIFRVSDCENRAYPDDFDKRQNEYSQCINAFMGFGSDETWFVDDENRGRYEEALRHCASLKPDWGYQFDQHSDEELRSVLTSSLAVLFHSSRASFIQGSESDYFFEGVYDCARIPNADLVTGAEEYPSTLKLCLYYDKGGEKELVKEWTGHSSLHHYDSLASQMFENRDALLRGDVPLTDITDDFEKMPFTCRIRGEKEIVSYNTEMKIKVSDFRDGQGRPSREFCRVAVSVKEGEILNGTTPAGLPRGKTAVFLVGSGEVNVDYRAPDTSLEGEETVRVYHCHTIRDVSRWPLQKTEISRQVIAEEKVPYKLPGVYATLSVTYEKERSERRDKGPRHRVEKRWTEKKEAKIHLILDKKPRESVAFDPATGKIKVTRYRYQVKEVSIGQASLTGHGTSDEDISGVHTVTASEDRGSYSELEMQKSGSMLVLDVDPETGEIVTATFPQFILKGNITHSTSGTQSCGERVTEINRTFEEKDFFEVSQDFGSDSHEEAVSVKEGNGRTLLKGGGRKESRGKFDVESFSSTWVVVIEP